MNCTGQTVVILASGPSLTAEHCETVRRWREAEGRVIVINTTWESAPWADVLYGCATWWKYHVDKVRRGFKGEMWTEGEYVAKQYGLNRVESLDGIGLCRDGRVFRGGGFKSQGNSGYQAVNLAVNWGARRIILLGFDMHTTEGRKNHHAPHVINIQSPYERWIPQFGLLARDIESEGVEVLNATPGSSLRCFSMIELAEALRARTVLAA